jgi:uncharacterized protein
MRQGMILFVAVFTLIQALWCFYVGRRLITPDILPPLRTWLWVGLILLFLLQWLIPVDMWLDRHTAGYSPFRTFLYWASYLTTGFLTILLFLVFFRDLAGWLLAGGGWAASFTQSGLSERLFSASASLHLPRMGLWLVLGTLLLSIAGYVQTVLPPHVARIEVPVRNLPLAFDGYVIAQFSDLHLGSTIRRPFVERVVRIVNSLSPDLVAFTGDVADGLSVKLGRDSEPLADIRAKDGKFFVTGNHEYYWDAPGWVARMGQLGYRVLMNEHVVIHRGDASLVVGGIPDFTARSMPVTPAPDIAKTFEGIPEGAVKILLAHQPKEAKNAAAAGVVLVLSGHTHAGQFIPFNLLTKLAQPYLGGTYHVGGTYLYVNRGTGYWGPPNRLGIPPEITLITLRRQ